MCRYDTKAGRSWQSNDRVSGGNLSSIQHVVMPTMRGTVNHLLIVSQSIMAFISITIVIIILVMLLHELCLASNKSITLCGSPTAYLGEQVASGGSSSPTMA